MIQVSLSLFEQDVTKISPKIHLHWDMRRKVFPLSVPILQVVINGLNSYIKICITNMTLTTLPSLPGTGISLHQPAVDPQRGTTPAGPAVSPHGATRRQGYTGTPAPDKRFTVNLG